MSGDVCNEWASAGDISRKRKKEKEELSAHTSECKITYAMNAVNGDLPVS